MFERAGAIMGKSRYLLISSMSHKQLKNCNKIQNYTT